MKQVQHEKKQPKKGEHKKNAMWKKCNMKNMQYKKSNIGNIHKNSSPQNQMDNGLSIDWTRPEIKVDIQVC